MSESYKYPSNGGDRFAQRMNIKDKLIHQATMKGRGYTLCAQAINDNELAYWYEPCGNSNSIELGRALVASNKLGLRNYIK